MRTAAAVATTATATTNGPRTLKAYLDGPPKHTQHELADKLGVGQSIVSMWKSGARCPGRKQALKLHKITGVPLKALLEPQRPRRRKPLPDADDTAAH